MTFVEVEPLAEYVVRTFTLERVSDIFYLIFCRMSLCLFLKYSLRHVAFAVISVFLFSIMYSHC